MSGSCSKQIGFAMKQRWQNRQPAGGSTALGISTSSRIRSLWSVMLGSGTAESRARVYGWILSPVSSLYGAISMTLPKYITMTRSLI